MTPLTESGDAALRAAPEQVHPSVASRAPRSGRDTPDTIMMMPHGTRRTARSSAALATRRIRRRRQSRQPEVEVEHQDARDQAPMMASVSADVRSVRCACWSSRPMQGRLCVRPAGDSTTKANDADDDRAGEVGEPDLASWPDRPRAGPSRRWRVTPTEETARDCRRWRRWRPSAPSAALARPCGRPSPSPAAHSATVEMAPGPIDDQRAGQHEDQHGHHPSVASGEPDDQVRRAPACRGPRRSQTAASPTRVRNSDTGKPARTMSGRRPAA